MRRHRTIQRIAVTSGIIAVLVISGLIAWPYLTLWGRNSSPNVQANIPRVEETTEEGYQYEYEAATFEVLMGEESENPKVKVRQGLRTLDITVETPPSSPAPGAVEPLPSPWPSVEPAPTPEPAPPEANVSSARDFWRWLSGAPAEAEQKIEVVNPDTEPAVEYQDKKFKLTPTLDKVTLDFEVSSATTWPTLRIQPENLTAYTDQTEVVFQTRTNRKAFALRQAVVRDQAGKTREVALAAHGQAVTLENGRSRHEVAITVASTEESLAAVEFPVTLEIDLVSLFHDRMLPVRPVKKDFRAGEDVEIKIDVSQISDEALKTALADDSLPDLQFGIIDAAGSTAELNAQVTERREEELTVALSFSKPEVSPGIFDVLIQHGSSETYISAEDFSWGVLTMNPDMAVYPEGATARIDMAVLDKMGRMVCDASVRLSITAPTGEETTLSTEDESIEVTPGCLERVTHLPDYTTSYQTGPPGAYTLELTATTNDGEFTITDIFSVDPSAPYYLKRTGPTRIYPLEPYAMTLEVTSASSATEISELVPSDFEIVDAGGATVHAKSGIDGAQLLVWGRELAAGEVTTLQYTFDAPDVSPAMFLLGPASINDYEESRQWQIASDDTATETFLFASDAETWTYTDDQASCSGAFTSGAGNPAGSLSTTGSKSGGGGLTCNTYWEWSGTWESLGVPAGANITGISGSYDYDVSNDSSAGSWNTGAFELRDSGGTLRQTLVAALTGQTGTATWTNRSGTEQTFTPEAATTSIRLRLNTVIAFGGGTRSWTGHNDNISVTVTYTVPTTEDLMRHGNYWQGGSEQRFFWVD